MHNSFFPSHDLMIPENLKTHHDSTILCPNLHWNAILPKKKKRDEIDKVEFWVRLTGLHNCIGIVFINILFLSLKFVLIFLKFLAEQGLRKKEVEETQEVFQVSHASPLWDWQICRQHFPGISLCTSSKPHKGSVFLAESLVYSRISTHDQKKVILKEFLNS